MDGSIFSRGDETTMPFHAVMPSFNLLDRPRRGIVSGTLVATRSGWRSVNELAPGDRVQTFDNGMQPIVDIVSETLWADATDAPNQPLPIVMRAGALNNQQQVAVLPHQGVMLESENANDPMGDPLAVVPARVLVGINGIDSMMPREGVKVYTIIFAGEEVIYADGGLMLHCPAALSEFGNDEGLYDVKSLVDARRMLTDLDVAQLVLDDEDFDYHETDALERVA